MDILGWLGWFVLKVLGFVWALAWFLLGGWVSTLAQIGVIALVIFGYKYGWRQAPQEILSRAARLAKLGWGWARVREGGAAPARVEIRERQVVRHVRQRVPGDVNLSTLLNILMLAGLVVAVLV